MSADVTRRGMMASAGALTLVGCGGARPVVVDAWTGLIGDLAQQLAAGAPERAAILPPALQPPQFRRLLSDPSQLGEERRRTAAIRRLAQVTGFDQSEIPPARQARHEAVVERLRAAADLAQLSVGRFGGDGGLRPYAIDPVHAAGITLPALLDAAPPFADLADAQSFVERVKAAPDAILADIEAAQIDAQRGFILPLLLLDRTVAVFDALAATPLEAFPARIAFVERATALGGPIDAAAPTPLAASLRGLLGEVDQAIRTGWAPAYQRTTAALRALRQRAPASPSFARAPEPLVVYRRCLDAVLGRGFEPAAARAATETRLAALQVELDGLLRAQGLADGSVGERLARVRAAPRPELLDPASLRSKILSEIAAFSAAAGAAFGQRFGSQAPAALAVAAAPSWRVPIGLGGGYRHADGEMPATLWVALSDPQRFSPLDQVIVSAREGTPGVHVAESLSGVTDDPISPILRLLPSAPTLRGWSAYALSLADEMGVIQNDPWARIGLLAGQMQIAAAALMEFDLNSADATWDAALASYGESTGDSRSQAERLGERILFEPGFGLAAEIGRSQIAALRETARTTLADRFDAKSFHTVILAAIPGPLSYLKRSVEDWIARR